MKFFFVFLLLTGLTACVTAELAAPYAPSGWRPDGPAFELPQRNQPPETYGPPSPIEPRRLPSDLTPDVSVQGLPVFEVTPQFQVTPVAGQQYVGRTVDLDIRSIDERYRMAQVQAQQQRLREIARLRQEYTASAQTNQPNNANQNPSNFNQNQPNFNRTHSNFNQNQLNFNQNQPNVNQQTTKPNVPTTEKAKMAAPDISTTDPTFNIGEVENESTSAKLTSVEISKQNVQEYPAELLLAPLAQLKLDELTNQQAFSRLILAPEYSGQIEFAVVPQRQNLIQPEDTQIVANPPLFVSREQQANVFLIPQQVQSQPNANTPQYPIQPVVVQPQTNSYPNQEANQRDVEILDQNQYQPQPQFPTQNQPKFVYQQAYQPQNFQPGQAYQPNPLLYQQQYNFNPFVNQDFNQQFYQQQVLNQNAKVDEQGTKYSDDEGSGDDDSKNNRDTDEGNVAVAVATAFGDRTYPRAPSQYGVPTNKNAEPTTERDFDESLITQTPPTVAEANAVARGSRKKSSKLRSRRVRPVFTVDNSGHLVLEQK